MKRVIACILAILVSLCGYADVFNINSSTADQGWRADGTSIWVGQTAENRIGTENLTSQKTFFIMPFLLPTLPDGHTITNAVLQIETWGSISRNSTISADLCGVRTSSSATVLSTDISGGTLLVDNWIALDPSFTAGVKTTSDAALATYLQGIYDSDPSAAGKYVFLALGPDAAYTNVTQYIRVYAADYTNSASRPLLTINSALLTTTTNLTADVNDQQWRSDGSNQWVSQTTVRIGSNTSGVDCGVVLPFWIPDLAGKHIVDAELAITIPDGTGLTYATGVANADVYGSRSATNSATMASDYTNGTKVVDNWFNISTNGITYGEQTIASTNLANWIDSQVGANGSKYVFITVRPDAVDGTYRYAQANTANNASGKPRLMLTIAGGAGAPAKSDQTISFANPGSQITTNAIVLNATASSGLPVTYGVVSGPASISGGSNVTFTASGSVTLSANQSGDSSWNAAPQTNVTFTVTKADATVTLSGLSQIYDGSQKAVSVSTAPSGLTVDVTYDGSSTAPTAVGNYAVSANVNEALYQGSATGTLSITSGELSVKAYAMDIRDVWESGTVRFPNVEMRVGQQTTNLSAGVMAFELPDLNGATILSASLKFRVNSKVGTMTTNYNCNINVEAIRSGLMGSAIVSSDYQGIGLHSGETGIQDDIVAWTDSLPRDYQMSGAATNSLGAWIADQYDSVGIAGVIFLRLAPDQDPATNSSSYYYSIPTDSIELTITTAGDTDPVSGTGNTVSARIGAIEFSWTFDRDVEWGHFIDGMPWVVMPASGSLNLVSATPARSNNVAAYYYINSTTSGSTNADINITVKNPPVDHWFNTNTWGYVDDASGVCGWDSRYNLSGATYSGTYNASLGWDGSTYLSLSVGDCVTTPKSTMEYPMPDRAAVLDALAVLTVLSNAPPADAFRPGVIRTGIDRTSPEIICYSDLIDLSAYVISNPVGRTTDLRGTNVTSLASEYTVNKIRACLPGPGFVNMGYSKSEGSNARFNNYAYAGALASGQYGGTLGNYMGYLAVGCLADWLTDDERQLCRIRYIQRAIDAYSAVRAGLCLEEGAGILPGYATLITSAGVMLDHAGMKSVNGGVNGVDPWWIFADYATCFHTDGVDTNDLVSGENPTNRLISLYNISSSRSNLNKTNAQPVAAATASSMTIKTNFYWDGSRPINNIINLKFKIVSGSGAGSTIYVITNTITAGVTDIEKFRTDPTATATLYVDGGNAYGYYYGGKVGIKPSFQNGLPDSNSVLAFSIMTSDTDNPMSDDACWYWAVDGVLPYTPSYFERVKSICASPLHEYSSIHTGGNIGNLILLYALGQQDLYKAGLDKYMINAGERSGYGEVLFAGSYLGAVGSGTTGNTRGALWKQEVLSKIGSSFQYTDGTSGALDVPHTHAKFWYEP